MQAASHQAQGNVNSYAVAVTVATHKVDTLYKTPCARHLVQDTKSTAQKSSVPSLLFGDQMYGVVAGCRL